jgi:hypothetical protein
MPKRPRRSRDPVQAAHQVYLEIIGEAPAPEAEREKNPAAVALGKLGGAKCLSRNNWLICDEPRSRMRGWILRPYAPSTEASRQS